MAEETKEEKQTGAKLSFKTADELSTFLADLQGQLANMQETVDKLAPVEGSGEETNEEDPAKEEPTEEEISEVDKLLQSE